MTGHTIELFPLPSGWSWTVTSEACASVRDGTHDTPKYVTEGVPLITSKNLSNRGLDFTNIKHISHDDHSEISKRSAVDAGDILFAMIGTIGNPVVVRTDAIFSIKNVGLFKKQLATTAPEYLCHWLSNPEFRKWLEPKLKGSTQKFAPLGLLRTLPLPLPPLPEQKRIVAKVESLQARTTRAREALESIPPLLEKFRQSILAAAFRGDLTKEWREKNQDKIEPASELLKRIRVERKKKWEEEQLKKFEAAGKMPKDDKWKEKYKEPEPVNTDGLPELPEGWCWASAQQLCSKITDGTHHSPPNRSAGDYPYITAKNIRQFRLSLDNITYVSAEVHREIYARCDVRKGDVLFVKDGVNTGDVVVNPLDHEFSLLSSVGVFRPTSELLPQYMMYCVGSPVVKKTMLAELSGSAIKRLTLEKLNRTLLPVPCIAEQHIIVATIDRMLLRLVAFAELESSVTDKLPSLDQSILAKAFRGELVPQDPNDEPASVLLDRIRKEREQKELEAEPQKRKAVKKEVTKSPQRIKEEQQAEKRRGQKKAKDMELGL